MRQDKLLTIREVSQALGIEEKEVIDLAEQGKIPAYKIGGVYLRFKPEDIQEAKKNVSKTITQERVSLWARTHDFFYFNDFYILSLLIIIIMILIIFKT